VFDISTFAAASESIVAAGRFLYGRGWSPATSSNYSMRLDVQHIAITVSGRHKGNLIAEDVMVVNLAGEPVQSSGRPSAETLLHTVIYELFPKVGAVLHTHSVGATVYSRLLKDAQQVRFADYELQKAFPGYESHEGDLVLPIFENTQDIAALAETTKRFFSENPQVPGYLIRGHGLYTWGSSIDDCLRHVEAIEFLLECELEMLRVQR
jgi:methylthioribulose-1-phosphate dehydratase